MKRLLHPFLLLPLLIGSLLLNGLLLVWRPWSDAAAPVQAIVKAPRSSTPAMVVPVPPTFDWSQLEAPDFATYIANLRRAGCPEATIRHLIEPELHAVFEARRQNADGQASAAEEAATLAALLGGPSVPPAPESSAPAVSTSASSHPSVSTASSAEALSVPAAFLVGNASGESVLQNGGLSTTPTDTTLAPETRQTLSDMRRQFGDQVTSSGKDPTSREFYLQWLKAQRASDDYFSALYGGDHFMRVQQQANLQRAQERTSTSTAK